MLRSTDSPGGLLAAMLSRAKDDEMRERLTKLPENRAFQEDVNAARNILGLGLPRLRENRPTMRRPNAAKDER
jgi:hypothetical protein